MKGDCGNVVCPDNWPRKLSSRKGPKIFETPGMLNVSVWLIRSIQNGSALLLISREPLSLGPQSRLCLPTEMSWPRNFVETYVSSKRNWLTSANGVAGCSGSWLADAIASRADSGYAGADGEC